MKPFNYTKKYFLTNKYTEKKRYISFVKYLQEKKASHSHNTENKFSKSCFTSTEIQTGVAINAHSIGYIHDQVKRRPSWLQHARVNRLRKETNHFIATL